MFDTIIVGIGPAALEASIYLRRYGLSVLLLGKDYGALERVEKIENYFGFSSISGYDLIVKGIAQAQALGALINRDEVLDIAGDYLSGFKVKTKKGSYEARTIIIATGSKKNVLPIAGANKYDGAGISYCATCDGFFYRKKKVGIIGNSSYLKEEYDVLKNICPNLTVFTNGKDLEVELDGANVVSDKISSFVGDERLEGVVINGNTIPLDGLFVALGSAGGYEFARHLGIICDDKKNIVVNNEYETNIEGIYAAGDVIGGMLQVVKAASDGANAAMNIHKKLSK